MNRNVSTSAFFPLWNQHPLQTQHVCILLLNTACRFLKQTNLDPLFICSVMKIIYPEHRRRRLWEAWKSLQREEILSEEWRKGPAAVICVWGAAALALAASAKQGHLISCCLQEAAVCCRFCCRYYSAPLVINLLCFNWSAPHCDAPAHTFTCWRK